MKAIRFTVKLLAIALLAFVYTGIFIYLYYHLIMANMGSVESKFYKDFIVKLLSRFFPIAYIAFLYVSYLTINHYKDHLKYHFYINFKSLFNRKWLETFLYK